MSRREPYEFKSQPEDGAKVFWKSLEDKRNPEAAQKRAEAEFPLGIAEAKNLVQLGRRKPAAAPAAPPADQGNTSLSRRGFMFFAGASAALAAEGCARRPVEKIMPYSKAPEHVLPGVSAYYATVTQTRGEAIGLLVESHEGRPTKVEGNPQHPSNRGSTDVWAQASVYDLYDPDRGTTPLKGTKGAGEAKPATWAEFDTAFADILRTAGSDSGARLRILYEPSASPTLLRLKGELAKKYPNAKMVPWTAAHDGNANEGTKLAFGQVLKVVPTLDAAKVILSIDSDFLGTEAGSLRASRGFANGRKLKNGPADTMNRLYVVEPSFTTTGMNADHRLRLPAQNIEGYLVALAKELTTAHGLGLGGIAASLNLKAEGVPEKWIKEVAKELATSRAASAILVGSRQPARVHALAHAINGALGNAGHTVSYFAVGDAQEQDPTVALKTLADDITKNAVSTLIILGGNPAFDAPADLKFLDRLKAVATTVHVCTHVNETSEVCSWYVPGTHELETWGDATAMDGTVAIQQPLIAPLFGGRSPIEILARVVGQQGAKGYDLVKQTFGGSVPPGAFVTTSWNNALKNGVAGPSARPVATAEVRQTEVAAALAGAKAPAALAPAALEVTFAACPKLLDGRYANNPLLQELPDPVTKVTWDNVALVSGTTAKALGVETGTVVRLQKDGGLPVDIALFIAPGQADNSIAVVMGWGRQKAGRYGNKHGFDVYPLRTTDSMGWASGVKVTALGGGEIDQLRPKLRKVGMAGGDSLMPAQVRPDDPFEVGTNKYKISQTQEHDTMEGRPVAIDATLEQYRKNPQFPQFPDTERKDRDQHGNAINVRNSGSPDPHTAPLWGDWKEESFFKNNHRWGMAIDLTSCTGCNACVIACQVENNVPAVGKEQIWRGREMYWLRVDRYFVGLDENDPQLVFQPVACVQCEEAPCENVCPVNATEHSPEGLNDMAYNRCIGTRYCANNCPYKVRRFNFLNYHTSGGWYDDVPEIEKMHYNPNVTVRMRGVMEKCTYCVQRIQEAKINSKRTGKPIKDGDVVPACQQACASECIVFGDLDDPTSKVAKWRAKDRNYRLLSELGTRPRTTYLGKIRNPNPAMEKA